MPEFAVRRALHELGYRFRLHDPQLPGKPDIVFPGRKKVIFVHGCYWHGHSCRFGVAQSKSNQKFWRAKLTANQGRDERAIAALRDIGWRVHVTWECEVKDASWFFPALIFLEDW